VKKPVVIIGLGEMAGVFARGLLRLGHPVYPVTRDMDTQAMANELPEPLMVLMAVGENDLHPALEKIPARWRRCLALLQNELLPRDWQQHHIENPTVVSVWFEKKKGQDFKVLIPSPVHGPHAELLANALDCLGIPSFHATTSEDIEYELVRKNVYILTTNIAGLETGDNVEALWNQHRAFACQVANEVMDIQAWLVGHQLDRDKLIEGLVEGIHGDLQHMCMGRSAPARLQRALGFADEAGLAVPTLRRIYQQHVKE
jgi:ketopantoate reductase